MISSIQAQKKTMKKKHYHHCPTNWLPQYYQKWIPTEQHHHACLLKLQKGFEHQNMLNRLFTIIHSRLGENEENKRYSSNL